MSDASLAIPCMWMRGGTSKGGYFLAEDLPPDIADRDAFLLRAMGSPDPHQIDGMGGGDPLTSKVALVKKSSRHGVDVDYLFLQIFVERALVSGAQNCGNILAGVGPFAIERGLVTGTEGETSVTIYMENTGQVATAVVQTPSGGPIYSGNAAIDGVSGTAAPIALAFRDIAGSSCGTLLPTGNAVDMINGVRCTLIDNGMPCIIINARDVGATGYESRDELDGADEIKARVESIRLAAGQRMNLGDVADKTVPKMMLVAPPKHGGTITVRSLIPHRVHASVGVLGAITVATAALIEGTPAAKLAILPKGRTKSLSIEHPTGKTSCVMDIDKDGAIIRAAVLRTARKLMDGILFS